MHLQNRITPFGEFIVTPARGTLMGNRGGRLHDAERRLTRRRWTSTHWICCRLEFKDRHRNVWGDAYSELFFLDEVTAFAAGHRPCFECRRQDAERFAFLFSASDKRATVDVMDRLLHAERLDGKEKRLHACAIDGLPDGAMIARDGDAFAVKRGDLLRWSPAGYVARVPRPSGATVDLLTPPSIVKVLSRGFVPQWHQTAETLTPAPAASPRQR